MEVAGVALRSAQVVVRREPCVSTGVCRPLLGVLEQLISVATFQAELAPVIPELPKRAFIHRADRSPPLRGDVKPRVLRRMEVPGILLDATIQLLVERPAVVAAIAFLACELDQALVGDLREVPRSLWPFGHAFPDLRSHCTRGRRPGQAFTLGTRRGVELVGQTAHPLTRPGRGRARLDYLAGRWRISRSRRRTLISRGPTPGLRDQCWDSEHQGIARCEICGLTRRHRALAFGPLPEVRIERSRVTT